LQLSRLDAGDLTIKKTILSLSLLLHSVKERWQQQLTEKKILLRIEVPEEVTIHTDKGFLEIILENLISNAIKYSGNGQIIVCSWNPEEQSLLVTDHGPGIPEDQIPYLFNRFYRTDQSRSSQVQGTGLGLSIVKTLADLLGITIGVSSVLNTGTTFTLKFKS
jgi:signal transduction histidine kinase